MVENSIAKGKSKVTAIAEAVSYVLQKSQDWSLPIFVRRAKTTQMLADPASRGKEVDPDFIKSVLMSDEFKSAITTGQLRQGAGKVMCHAFKNK